MKQSEHLQDLQTLCDQARDQSEQIGAKLDAGAAPETLVPLLKHQTQTIAQFQTRLVHFAQSGEASAFATEIDHLKTRFEQLIQTSEQHLQKAQQKGVRLSGIGGKPHIPRPISGKRQ